MFSETNLKIVSTPNVAKTSASTATISRVNRSLNYTSCDGYSLVFERLKELEAKESE